MSQPQLYNKDFYQVVTQSALKSGRVVTAVVQDALKVKSVLDLGCGQGGWLKAWNEQGASDILGLDGDYVDRSELVIPIANFKPADLRQPQDLGRQFDLVQSLEVAEHLEIDFSETFVETLTRHGKLILFSAAYPGDGGTDHVNEQPFEFWRDKFMARGYRLFDFVRPKVADNESVEYWYRYNTFLFAHESVVANLPSKVRSTEILAGEPIPVVSPFLYRLRCKILAQFNPKSITRLAQFKTRLLIARSAVLRR